ncbi:MAG: bifunctional 4-hydroxy-2-oxoglutarate aldolase/2-dehydro-3-deoxy-phosphogluconate aldolase [Sedimentisphaerales bacterium]|nr:bifunctional 4-hydroxy-2-oxoglutarate aldolase/2-dehydro-3-deoxy-phosphogluconate aldolase [Sedimentisphaerales bacterium]
MADYEKNRRKVDAALRKSGIVVVMNKKHVRNAEDLVTTMYEVYKAGYVAECTYRIDEGIITEAMAELRKKRDHSPADNPFLLGVGSIINPKELESAIELGFDMIVAPANVMGGHGQGKEFVKICHDNEVFCAPAIFTPNELQYFIERPDGLEPDAIKVFPANSHGADGIKGLLAPYVRQRHNGRIIMPTGGVDFETGPKFQQAISANGFTPILGMSAPLKLVEAEKKPGDVETIRKSLREFAQNFKS